MTKVKNSRGMYFGSNAFPGLFTQLGGGDMYIRISLVKPSINSDVHLICDFPGALQWNCPLASRFNLDRISQDQQNSSS